MNGPIRPRHHRVAALAMGALALLGVAACGVPSRSPATAITQVPYNLMEPAAPATPQPSTPARQGPFVYWVNDADGLTAIEAGASTNDAADTAATVLTRLAQGPSELERLSGLSTALGPGASLTIDRIEDGQANVEIAIGVPAPSARRLPLAVGQIVLSLTSVSGIDAVLLTNGGAPIEAPLPDGALTDRPLTADDFSGIVTRRPASSTTRST